MNLVVTIVCLHDVVVCLLTVLADLLLGLTHLHVSAVCKPTYEHRHVFTSGRQGSRLFPAEPTCGWVSVI